MSFIKKIVLPSFIILLTVFLLFIFRSVPVTKLWTGYSTIYVQKDASVEEVVSILKKNGISEIIYLENQRVPLAISKETPEIALALSGSEKSDYLQKRNLYFFDNSQNFKLYYVEDKYEHQALIAQQELQQKGIKCGINASSSYPFLSILICIIFASLLVFYSNNKKLAVLSMIFPVLLCFSIPFYTVMASSCLLMYGIFISIKLWNREGAVKRLLTNKILISFASFSLILMLLISFKAILLYIITLVGIYSSIFLYNNLSTLINSRYSVNFINIRPARFISLIEKNSTICMLICAASLLSILTFASLSSVIHPSTNKGSQSGLLLPGVSSSGSLPDINDFIDWRWETMTYPYISVNEKNYKNDKKQTISFVKYSIENGLIVSKTYPLSFDDEFIKNSYQSIQDLDYPALEKIFTSQRKKQRAGYIASGSQTINFFIIIQLIIAFSIPVVFYFLSTANRIKRWEKK